MTPTTAGAPAASRFRWTICAMLFFATTVNYLDRQVLSILAKTLETSIGWDSVKYGYITSAFQASYGIGLLAAGRLMDRVGVRIGYALAVAVWSLAAMLHAAAASAFAFGVARFALGMAEAANFPACVKTVAEWFPKRERALANSIFNSGTNVGAVVAPLTVPWLAVTYGWQWAFIGTGALGFIWIVFWLASYRNPAEHPKVSPSELAIIQSDPPDKTQKSTPWAHLFPKRETWAFAVGKFLTDPVWWFFLFWTPMYLQETFGLSLKQIVIPTVVIYNVCTVGGISAGWLSGRFIKMGWTVNAARKTTMLICAICVAPVLYAPYCGSLWMTVALISLATAAHQGWSANLFTLVTDTFPKSAVGSVVGIGGTFGMVASVLVSLATGFIVKLTGGYLPLFIFAGFAYFLALWIIHTLSPKLAPAEL